MLELKYKQNSGPWPLKAAANSTELSFSGNFNPSRVKNEQYGMAFSRITVAALWILAALGAISLVFSVKEAAAEQKLLFFLDHSSLNLMFWTGSLAACYLWAKLKQEQLDQESLNLLHWEETGPSSEKKPPLDIYSLFNKEAKTAWNNALHIANDRQKKISKLLGQNSKKGSNIPVAATDLFLSLAADSNVQLAFFRLGVNIGDIKTLVSNYAALSLPESENELDKIPFIAFAESLKLHNRSIDPLMLLCALAASLPQEHIIQAVFFNINLSLEKLEVISAWIFNLRLLREDLKLFKKLAGFKPDSEINKGLTSIPTPYLDRYSADLTREAKHGLLPVALGRGMDLHEIFRMLADGSRNILIKGPAGSGRTTLINELAYKMASEQVPKILEDKRLVKLEISSLLGSPQKSEDSFIHVLREAQQADNIILVIEDIHMLAKSVTASGLNLLEMLTGFLENHPLMVIGTTTVEDHSDYLQENAGFEENFAPYELSHLSREGVLLACCIKASLMENKGQCLFRYQAIEQAIDATDLYVKNGVSQPQKAIAVLVEAATKAKSTKTKIITEELIQKIVSEKTHIPSSAFSQSEAQKLLSLETILAKYVIGQEQAVAAVAEGLRRARSGLSSAARPLASFLFLGPTGVGKTEVAKTLANVYFGEEKYLVRLDMSEYRGTEGLSKLLGQPESKTDTALVKHLKNYPFGLLLLDEFEKASPEIYNLFLQVLEDGRLTSGRGETLDLTQCLIIATSNAGTADIQNGLRAHKSMEQIKAALFSQTLSRLFPPELINRFDGVILFSPLSEEQVKKITRLQLQNLKAKLNEKGIKVEFSDRVVLDIANKAYDPLLGARPIRRYIQDHIEGFIAKLLLGKKLARGSSAVIDYENGQMTIK